MIESSGHLPECQPKSVPDPPLICICPELRACERRLIEWVRITIVERIFDLEACHKDDNCRILAQGADLALSDVLYEYPRRMERYE